MQCFEDRPYPMEYIHPNGMTAKIQYRWGEGDPTFPIGLRIELDLKSYRQVLEETATYCNLDELKSHSLRLAKELIERAIQEMTGGHLIAAPAE
ncbi:hypothetical protein D3C76_344920 [compost metagenome]